MYERRFTVNSSEEGYFEYPYDKKWVYASAALSGISIAFAVSILRDDVGALLLYFAFTSFFTLIILALKFHFYSEREKKMVENYSIEDEKEAPKRGWMQSLILLMVITLLVLLSPLILSYLLDPLWWVIIVSGFVPGVSIPEIILFIYSQRQLK